MTQSILNVIGGLYSPYDFEALTVDATSGGVQLSASKIRSTGVANALKVCQRVVMTNETAQIRYTYDGTTVTSSVGHIMGVSDVLTLVGIEAIENFRAIRTGGTSGALKITFER